MAAMFLPVTLGAIDRILDAKTLMQLEAVLERQIGFYHTERYQSSLGNRAPLVFIRQEHPEYAQLYHLDEVKLVQLFRRTAI